MTSALTFQCCIDVGRQHWLPDGCLPCTAAALCLLAVCSLYMVRSTVISCISVFPVLGTGRVGPALCNSAMMRLRWGDRVFFLGGHTRTVRCVQWRLQLKQLLQDLLF